LVGYLIAVGVNIWFQEEPKERIVYIETEGKEAVISKQPTNCYVYGYWKYYDSHGWFCGQGINAVDSAWRPFPPESCYVDTVVTITTLVKRRLFFRGELNHETLIDKGVVRIPPEEEK